MEYIDSVAYEFEHQNDCPNCGSQDTGEDIQWRDGKPGVIYGCNECGWETWSEWTAYEVIKKEE
jgi:predicted RNA-binding Zn-ribbon protein involved in translation (DUF1610 family)